MLFFFSVYICGTYDKTCSINKFCFTRLLFLRKKHIIGADTHIYEGSISHMNVGTLR